MSTLSSLKWLSFLTLLVMLAGCSPADPDTLAGSAGDALESKGTRIAVIGAGAAGLTAAYTLKKLGYKQVTVFEKEGQVGGKVSTYFYQGRPYEMGAVWITNDYSTVKGLVRELGVEKMPARRLDYMTADGTVLNGPDYLLRSFNPGLFSLAGINFVMTLIRYAGLNWPGFVGLPRDLHLPLEDFSIKYKFLPLTQSLAAPMSGCGYGFYQEIPAQYWLKLMPMVVNSFFQGLIPNQTSLWSFPAGFQQLWEELAKGLDVRLNSEVTRITRTGQGRGTRIVVTAAGVDHEFDRVILAIPLDKARGLMQTSAEEQDLFGRIRNLRYAVTLARTNNRAHAGLVGNVTPDRVNHVNLIGQYYGDTDVSSFYQMLDPTISAEDAMRILRDDLVRAGVRIDEVLTQKIWTYFPHVTPKDLDEGFYERLDALQGKQGTYYIGSLLSFESVEHTASFAKALVKRFFPFRIH